METTAIDTTNFTLRAQGVLALAREQADRFNHNFVGTEHLLLALIVMGQGTAVNVLKKMGLELETIRMNVESQVGAPPEQKLMGTVPYTPRAKKVLAFAAKQAAALDHTYVGTEHILLGLLLEGDGLAARVLKNLGVEVERTRQEILKELDPCYKQNKKELAVGLGVKSTPVENLIVLLRLLFQTGDERTSSPILEVVLEKLLAHTHKNNFISTVMALTWSKEELNTMAFFFAQHALLLEIVRDHFNQSLTASTTEDNTCAVLQILDKGKPQVKMGPGLDVLTKLGFAKPLEETSPEFIEFSSTPAETRSKPQIVLPKLPPAESPPPPPAAGFPT